MVIFMYILQISCISILAFLLVLFLVERRFDKGTRKLYVALLIVSILGLLFEIFAIYSLHNINMMSPVMFKTIHRAYLTFVLTYFYLNFRYKSAFVFEETGMQDRGIAFMHVAQVILYAGIFLLPLGYDETESSVEFLYGPGVWVVYVGAAFYLFVIFSNYIEQMRRIAKEKLFPLILGVACGMVSCFYYMCDPSSNVSGIGIVIVSIAMYISLHAADKDATADADCEACREMGEQEEVLRRISFKAPDARVLIVDDSEMNRKMLKNLLKKTGMKMDEAAGGKECLELVRRNTYHLIFMDHLMPEMDGLETFASMKKEHLCDGVPVVAMTANALSMTEKDYLAMGFAAFASKPILPESLEMLVYKVLGKSLIKSVEKEEMPVQPSSHMPEEPEMESMQQESWEKLPPVNGLDYDYAALHFKSSSELSDMIRFLTDVMRPDMKELQSYYRNIKDDQELRKFCTKVHSMKNSAMTVGIVPLAGLAKTLEDAAKEENEVQIRVLMPIFEEKWEKYRLLLIEKFGFDNAQKISANPHTEEITALFRSLREAAEAMDIDALDEIMKQIDTYAFAPEYEEKLQQIRQAVMNFDVDYLKEEGYL